MGRKYYLSHPRTNTQLPNGMEVIESKWAPWVNLLLTGLIYYALIHFGYCAPPFGVAAVDMPAKASGFRAWRK